MLIDQLPEITTANDSDEMPIEQGTTTRKIKILNLLKGVVKKAGDTMTGSLVDNANIYRKVTGMDSAATAEVYSSGQIAIIDKNDRYVGYMQTTQGNSAGTNADVLFSLVGRKVVNGSNVDNRIDLGIQSNGARTVSLSDAVAWRDALGVAPYTKGTWTPKLYDYETYKQDLPTQDYYKIGDFYVCKLILNPFPETTFSTMIQIRNLPCKNCIGGSTIYYANVTSKGGDWTVQGGVGNTVLLRPNFTGTTSTGIFTMIIFGTD